MPHFARAFTIALVIQSAFASGEARARQADPAERDSAYRAYLGFGDLVRGGRVDPNWMADGDRFWYTEDGPDGTVAYLVDPDGDPVVFLLDPDRLGEITASVDAEPDHLEPLPVGLGPFGFQMFEILSPDGRWFAHRKDHDLWLRAPSDSTLLRLTTDGEEGHEWGEAFEWTAVPGERPWVWWSPAGSKLALRKVDTRPVPRVALVRPGGREEDVEWMPYARAGDPLERRDFYFVDIATRRQVRIDAGLDPEGHLLAAGWSADGSTWLFVALDRAHRRLDLVAADAATGEARILLTETAETAFKPLWSRPPTMRLLAGDRFLWSSERDGWNHLYLYDLRGNLVRRLTEGPFPVMDVLAVDEESGWVYFTAHGDRQRPYDTHLYRVGLDGAGFARLTEDPGQHAIRMSPSMRYFVDTHSSVDRPYATDLRRVDGRLVRTLSRADVTALESVGWVVPEEVIVTATDGVTDLHGVLYKPHDFDPSRRYPVIEYIYDAWNTTVVQRTFSPAPGGSTGAFPRDAIDPIALAQLGYVVWVMDGRGSDERGRAFRNVWARDGGFDPIPDHVAALEQLGRDRPYMDLERVGVFGISAGGGQTLHALFRAPELYDVGVAIAAPAGARNTLAGGVEPLLGLPDENPEAYEHGVLDEVDGLQGDLLIMQGVADRVVSIDHTFRLVDALIEAGKPYDLLLVPNGGHSFYGPEGAYARDALRRFFLEHLPPDP